MRLPFKPGPIVVLTGAGISAESGISTFRDSGGLWENHSIEEVATPEGFYRNPDLVQKFYNERRRQMLAPETCPNAAHEALARLEAAWPHAVTVVTQNIDNLHERGGSENVIHMHGELLKVRCSITKSVFEWTEDVTPHSACHCCGMTSTLRPHIVWFGEMPYEMDRIYKTLDECVLFVSIGTSGHVYPAAGFVHEVKRIGVAHTVELNLEPSKVNTLFDEHIYGKATEVVPPYVDKLIGAIRARPRTS